MKQKIRFSVVFAGITSHTELIDRAQKAEAMGFHGFYLTDHFETAELAPGVALMAVAAATKRIQIGSFVYNNDFRHPALLAKEAATLDLLSNGRFQLGIGPGYLAEEYEHAGIPLDSPGIRIERMTEALHIIKQFFKEDTVSFAGKYYTINGLQSQPKVVQNPHPPIYIGGGGKRMLSLAAQMADVVGLTAIVGEGGRLNTADFAPEATAQKIAWIRQAAGDRLASLTINCLAPVIQISKNRKVATQQVAAYTGLSVEQVLASPHYLIGSVKQICQDFKFYQQEYGITSYTIIGKGPMGDGMEAFAPVMEYLA